MKKLPYILFESPPIGPIALEVLTAADYPPVYVINDPKLSVEEQLALIEKYKPTFFLVVGFGAILKQEVLDTVAGQVLNIHPSLLPLYRGPAPVVQVLLDGVTETGVTLMEIDKKMDHGAILDQTSLALHGNETPDELYTVLTRRGVELFLEHVDEYLDETLETLSQNHDEATFTHFITKEDGHLDFSKTDQELEREIRAFRGWPRSWTIFDDKRLIVEKARLEQGKLIIESVQPEGKKVMTLQEFCVGKRIKEEEFYRRLRESSSVDKA